MLTDEFEEQKILDEHEL